MLQQDPMPWLLAAQPYTRCANFIADELRGSYSLRFVLAHWPRVLCYNASSERQPGMQPGSTPRLSRPDMQFMDDARWDSAGPGSTDLPPF